jgi:hypothetical protein
MKASFKLVSLIVASALLVAPAAFAQRGLGKKKGPTSKLYLAETQGEAQIINEGKAHEAKQATAFDAPGTIIETKDGAHQAFVYSNGTGMYVDENTRVEVDRFVQEPFQPDRNSTETEPSISQSDVFVARGLIGICTSQMVSGSTMNYATPHAGVNIRGGKIAIQSTPTESVIYLLEGDATIRGASQDKSRAGGGEVLRPGERAVIRPGPPGQPPTITIGPIDNEVLTAMDDKVAVACNAKKTVSFETIEKQSAFGAEGGPEQTGNLAGSPGSTDSDQEIVANPTVPTDPPTNITVSKAMIEPTK